MLAVRMCVHVAQALSEDCFEKAAAAGSKEKGDPAARRQWRRCTDGLDGARRSRTRPKTPRATPHPSPCLRSLGRPVMCVCAQAPINSCVALGVRALRECGGNAVTKPLPGGWPRGMRGRRASGAMSTVVADIKLVDNGSV